MKLNELEQRDTCPDCGKPHWTTFFAEGKKKGVDGKACWKGYRFAGTENGKDKCVKVKKRKK